MSKKGIWEKYEKKEKINNGTYGTILKAKNKETGYYVAIKEIDKEQYNKINNKIFNENELINKILIQDNFCFKEIFNSNDYCYIVMDLCINNLEDYIKNRENEFSINEIKELLNQINNNLKKIQNEKYIYKSLKLSNLQISINQIDKILIKFSNIDLIKYNEKLNVIYNEIPFTVAPEILIDNFISNKSLIWNLGILIYFIIFKEYPYNGKNKDELINDIKSKKKIKVIKNNELNDLVSKMLKINFNERISWDDYLNHSFFKNQKNEDNNLPQFDFYCKSHNKINNTYYCKNCGYNFCENCLKEHSSKNHFVMPFSKIGLNNEEKSKIKNLLKKIEKNINYFNKLKSEIHSLFDKMKLIKENNFIYENDIKNNYKKYYIDILNMMNEKIKIEKNKINIIDLSINQNEKNISINQTNENDNSKNNNNSNENTKSNEKDKLNNYNESNENNKTKDIDKLNQNNNIDNIKKLKNEIYSNNINNNISNNNNSKENNNSQDDTLKNNNTSNKNNENNITDYNKKLKNNEENKNELNENNKSNKEKIIEQKNNNNDRIIIPNPLPEIDLTNIEYTISDFTNKEFNYPQSLYSINSFYLIKYELQSIDDSIKKLNKSNIPQELKDKRNNLECRQKVLQNYLNENDKNSKRDYCISLIKAIEKYKKLLKYFIDNKNNEKAKILKEGIYILNLELNQFDKNLIDILTKELKEEKENFKESSSSEDNADKIFNIPNKLPEIDLKNIKYRMSDFTEDEIVDPRNLSLIITLNSILYEIQCIDDGLKRIEGRTPKEIRQRKNRLYVQSNILKSKIEDGKISKKQYKQICKNVLDKHLKLLKYFSIKNESEKMDIIKKRIYLINMELEQI